ncbi:hypothetical protein OKW41_002751 [Paraburkholderia sp. UCT70]
MNEAPFHRMTGGNAGEAVADGVKARARLHRKLRAHEEAAGRPVGALRALRDITAVVRNEACDVANDAGMIVAGQIDDELMRIHRIPLV